LEADVVEGDTPILSGSRTEHWADASTWSGGGIHREVFFFRSAEDQLFGSLFFAERPTRRLGLIVCYSWGREAEGLQPLYRGISEGMARRGGAGLEFHPPGHGDSGGRPEELTVRRLVDAAIDARREAERRVKEFQWVFAGVRLGAAIATIAAQESKSNALLLLQPELDPAEYFDDMLRRARRSSLGRNDSVFGIPLSDRTRSSAADVDVREALAGFGGRTLVVSYAPSPNSIPIGAEMRLVKGTWLSGEPHLALASNLLDLLLRDR
jgi:hypothetical protein